MVTDHNISTLTQWSQQQFASAHPKHHERSTLNAKLKLLVLVGQTIASKPEKLISAYEWLARNAH